MSNVAIYDQPVYELYLNEVRKYPVLSKEEEFKYAEDYYKYKTITSAEILIKSNLRYVIKIANKYKKYSSDVMDLIQEGNVGLMLSLRKFDPYQEIRLVTYANKMIRYCIERYIRKSYGIVSIDSGIPQKLFFNPEKHEGVISDNEIKFVENFKKGTISLNEPVLEGSDENKIDRLVSNRLSPEEIAIKSQIKKKMKTVLENLNDRQKHIVYNRLMSDTPQTSREIAQFFGVSTQAIQQNEDTVKKKLKQEFMQYENFS